MKIIETNFEGVSVIEPAVHYDERGYFFESYNKSKVNIHGIDFEFVQDNEARSVRGVLRGLHYQLPPYGQTKLVRVTQGEVLDVILDLRPGSKTLGKYLSVILSDSNFKQLLVPTGFAHGYIVLSDIAVFNYKCDNFYDKDSERGILYSDSDLNIDWILPSSQILVSEKDQNLPSFKDHSIFI